MDLNSFECLAGCVVPLIRGSSLLCDVGCDLECYVIRVIGETMQQSVIDVMSHIVMSLRQLPPPIADKQSITYRSDLGIEKRTVSNHCASVYNLLGPLITSVSPLLTSSLVGYLIGGLEQGLTAITAIEGRIYRDWVQQSDHKISIILSDLYFFSLDLLPLLHNKFCLRLPEVTRSIARILEQFKSLMTSCTILLLQEICTDALKVMQFRPSFYATMTENVISPQIGTITAVKRLLYVLRQCEKIMSPISFNMMKKALFSSFYALLLKNQEWSTIKVNEVSVMNWIERVVL